MIRQLIKRNGAVASFDKQKIVTAIVKAFHNMDKVEEADVVAQKIAQEIENLPKTSMSVEEIQDIVEKKLMATAHKDVAKSYINYRYLRNMARSHYKELWDSIEEKLSAKKVQNQNANVDEHSFGGRIGEASSIVTKQYALEYIVSPMARANHENNEIYIHDLDAYAVGSHNCMSMPLDDLLANGFNTRQTDVRPAGSVATAFQLVAVLMQLQSLNQFGGVSATHLDWTMVPYVRKSFYKHYQDIIEFVNDLPLVNIKPITIDIDEATKLSINDKCYDGSIINKLVHKFAIHLTKKEVHQAVEGLYHNLNTLQSRSGNQLKRWLALQ